MVVDLGILFLLSVFTLTIGALGFVCLRTVHQRVVYTLGMLGTYLYSGIGASALDVPVAYVWMYCAFLLCLAASFLIGARARRTQLNPSDLQLVVDRNVKLFTIFVVGYTLMNLFPLVYPEFVLSRLINPPAPNISAWFFGRFEGGGDLFTTVHTLMKLLFFPFFLIGLYALRQKKVLVFVFLFLDIYIRYCADQYVGRYDVAQYILLFFLALYVTRAMSLRGLLAAGIPVFLGFVVFYGSYQQIRLGIQSVESKSLWASLSDFISGEFYYSRYADVIIEAGQQIDLGRYVTWIVTLPIPKALIGTSVSLQLNYAISTFLTGKPVGRGGTEVLLVSTVLEGVFIYGRYFFWLHACSLGLIFGLLTNLLQRSRALDFVTVYVSTLFLLLARGGVGSVLPVIVNAFILLYAWMFVLRYLHRPTLSET